MTVEELKQIKESAENAICDILVDFEKRTGESIMNVSYEKYVREDIGYYDFKIRLDI